MFRLIFRIVGATEDDTPFVAVVVERPEERQVARRDTRSVVSRIDVGHRSNRARKLFGVDNNFEVRIRGGGDQVVGASQHVQVLDDGTCAEVARRNNRLIGINRSRASSVDSDIINHIMESNPHILTSISGQADGVRTPVLITVACVTNFCLGTIVGLGTAIPNLRKAAGSRVGSSGNADREVLRIVIVGVVGPEGDRGVVVDAVLLKNRCRMVRHSRQTSSTWRNRCRYGRGQDNTAHLKDPCSHQDCCCYGPKYRHRR